MSGVLEFPHRAICPHCDAYMVLTHPSEVDGFFWVCKDGCKAEFQGDVKVGKVTTPPLCGAKRIKTAPHAQKE